MKIAILAVRDTGGTAYTLAHAINSVQKDCHAIDIRGVNNFIDYPAFVEMDNYSVTNIGSFISKADVIVFLGAMRPFFDRFRLSRNKLKHAKKMLLCMGSEWRWGRKTLKEQADRFLGDYKIVLGGADMFMQFQYKDPKTEEVIMTEPVDESEVAYLPVVRSMTEIQSKFGMCNQDLKAVEAFGIPKKKVVYTHAPTSEWNKGSPTFYAAVTRAQQCCPNLCFTTVRQQPWVTTLRTLSQTDVLLDQAPPYPTAYGALSVEAGIFHVPSFSRIAPECQSFIKRYTGLKTPYITFTDDEDLFKKVARMASDEKLRKEFGDANYEFCRKVHDEKPVVDRFMRIVEEMN